MIDLNSEVKGLDNNLSYRYFKTGILFESIFFNSIAKKYYLFLNQATVSLTWTYASTG